MPRYIAVKAVYSIVSSVSFENWRGQPATARGSGRLLGATTGGVMQLSQGVCASTVSRPQVRPTAIRLGLRLSSTPLRRLATGIILCLLVLGSAAMAHAQGANNASLAGTVLDPSNAAVKGAKVTATSVATGSERTAVSGDNGRYNLVGLPPGQYNVSVDGGPNFEVYKNASVVLTVGATVTQDIK